MAAIIPNLPQLIKAIECNQPVLRNKKGEWYILNKAARFVKNIFFKKKEEDKTLIAFHKALAQAETFNLYFDGSEQVMQKQMQFYQEMKQMGRAIIMSAARTRSDKVKDLSQSLELAMIKLQYRLQNELGGYRVLDVKEIDPLMVEKIRAKVDEYQKKDEKYEFTQKLDFSAQIEEICQYPHIANFLLNPKNTKQADEYFQRAIRDNFSIDALNQYHYESKLLCDNLIGCRVGALGRKLLTVDLEPLNGCRVKALNMLMENRKINLLNKDQIVHFSNGLDWKLPRIYEDFRKKNVDPGYLEVLWEGIVPFNGHELAPRIIEKSTYWDKFKLTRLLFKKKPRYEVIDTTKPDWYKKTKTLDIRSKDYLEKRFGVTLQPGKWLVVLEATRRNELDVDKAHGYSLFYEPIGNDQYRVYSFGAFPLRFPRSKRELIDFAANTVKGTIAFDPNYFYSQSQKASWPNVVDENVAKALLQELGMEKKKGVIFQLGWENCAYFIRNLFEKVLIKMGVVTHVPQFFKKKFLNAKPAKPLLYVQKIFKNAPKGFLHVIKLIVALLVRAKRSISVDQGGVKVKKSLWESPFFGRLEINLPSAMHHRIKKELSMELNDPKNYKKKFNCVLTYGHIRSLPVAPAA